MTITQQKKTELIKEHGRGALIPAHRRRRSPFSLNGSMHSKATSRATTRIMQVAEAC